MKKIILLSLISFSCLSQVTQIRDNVTQRYDKEKKQYINTHVVDTVVYQPEWGDVMMDFNNSKVYYDMLSGNSGLTAAFTNCINDGKSGNATPDQLKKILLMFTFTDEQRKEMNEVLTKNFFDIKL